MGKTRDVLRNLYTIDATKQPWMWRAALNLLRFLNELLTQFVRDTLVVRASGMAYNTLLAIVPLVAVFFSVFTSFERFAAYKGEIQDWLFKQIIPARTDEIVNYINQFTANTKALGLLSTALLFVTSILLFDNIETNFNAVWKTASRRSLLQRFLAFTSVILWGPVLIALSFYGSGKVWAFINGNPLLEISFIQRLLMNVLPWFFSVFAFFLMLSVIPAARVKKQSALVGGVVGATIWEIAKVGFTRTTAKSITYNALYGSLAVAPIFLVWLYLTWIIVLLALEVAYVHHNFAALVLRRAFAKPSARERLHLAVRIFAMVADAFHKGSPPPTVVAIEERFKVPSELTGEIVEQLRQAGLLRTTELGREDVGYLPGRSLESVKLGQVAAAAYANGQGAETEKGLDAIDRAVSTILEKGETAAGDVYGRTTFLALIESAARPPE
jgi:membrane protein